MLFTKEFEEKIMKLKTEEEVANAIKAEYSDSDVRKLDIDELENLSGGSYKISDNTVFCLNCGWAYKNSREPEQIMLHYLAHRYLRHRYE